MIHKHECEHKAVQNLGNTTLWGFCAVVQWCEVCGAYRVAPLPISHEPSEWQLPLCINQNGELATAEIETLRALYDTTCRLRANEECKLRERITDLETHLAVITKQKIDYRAYVTELEAKLQAATAEVSRLIGLCTSVHDRMLRGDSDEELLARLKEGWQGPNTTDKASGLLEL